MSKRSYHPEDYWSEVGQRIANREDGKNVIAGDDEPYYRYKRKRFLKLLNKIDFSNKSVMELGSGPGGNLLEICNQSPARLVGVDISEQMLALARNKVPEYVELVKTDGTHLTFADREFDIAFTATVLQHNTDEKMLKEIMGELGRVCSDKVYLFERIEKSIKGDELCYGRPVKYYSEIMENNGFRLTSKEFINIKVSYYVSGAIRKLLNPSSRKEGEPLNKLSVFLQNTTLPATSTLDKVFSSPTNIARLEFERIK
jgi:ubiquinone/menaquinone biosynthesis C-methylase UbiE